MCTSGVEPIAMEFTTKPNCLSQWPGRGPELLWVSKGLGRGYAAPVITEDQIFVNGEQEGKSYLYAFDLEGKTALEITQRGGVSRVKAFPALTPEQGLLPQSWATWFTPLPGRDVLPVLTKKPVLKYGLSALSTTWEGELAYFGYSESVAVDDENVYCFPGGAQTNMAALNRFYGKDGLDFRAGERYFRLWFTGTGGPAGQEES